MRVKHVRVWGLLVILLTASGAVTPVEAQKSSTDWPQFRGVNRDGISAETGLSMGWPEEGPKEVWRQKVGPGYSSISIVGEHGYTMWAAELDGEPTEFAVAFDIATGKELWRTPVGERYDNEFGDGPRSTPTVDGKTVYVLSSRGDLLALKLDDGSEIWSMSLTEKFGGQMPYFGFSTSTLVDGNQLLIEGGGPDGKAYASLNKKTGEVNWTSGSPPDSGPGYNSPIAVTMGGERRYVYLLGDKMTCMDDKGNEVWTHPWPYPGETHAMPIFVPPNKIYASGAEGVGAQLVAVTEDGGKATVEEVWKTRLMKNHFSSAVIVDGYVYGFDNATLRAISVEDGETAWAKRGYGKGSLIYADGHLLVLSDKGLLLSIEATPEAYREKGRVQALSGKCWTNPTLSAGKLYLRNHDEMVVYDLTR
jgi:outer membrane protein assembly factor BamB